MLLHPFSRLENLLWTLIQIPYSRQVFILGFQIQCAGIKCSSILTIPFWASAKPGVEGDFPKWELGLRPSIIVLITGHKAALFRRKTQQYIHAYLHAFSFLNLAQSKISSLMRWQTNITHYFSCGFQLAFECNESSKVSGTWLCKRLPSTIAPCAAKKIACLFLNGKILQTHCQGWKKKKFIAGFYSKFSPDKDSLSLQKNSHKPI